MGSRGQYMESRRFVLRFESHYHKVGEIEGVKILEFNAKPNSALPEYAKTADAYMSRNGKGEMLHLRVFEAHEPILEFDVGHWKHYGKEKGYVHVHDYSKDANGFPVRITPGRDPSAAELARYGTILRHMRGSLA